MADKTNNNKNDSSVSFGVDLDTSGFDQAEKYFSRAKAFIKSFVTSMNNMFNALNKTLKLDSGDAFSGLTDASLSASANSLGVDSQTVKDAQNATESLQKSNRKIVESNKEVARSFELIDYAAVGVFRRILKTATNIYKKLALAGSNMTETNSRFTYVLGSLSEEAEGYAEAIANAYAITETEAKTAITRVYQMAKSAGLSSSTALKMAKDLTVVGAELSSVWDVSTEQSVNALISALQGLPKAAKNLGVFTNVNEYKELLKEAGIETEGVLTQNEKITGAFLKILKDSGYAIGDFARTQTSVANQLRLVNSAVTSISENLGSTMNTILSPLLQIVNEFLKYLVRATNILNDMPEPIKMVVGLFATMAIAVPVLVSLFVLLIRVKQIFKKQMEGIIHSLERENSKMAKLGSTMLTTVIPAFTTIAKVAIPFVIFIGTLITLFDKLNEKTEDNKISLEQYIKAVEDSQRALGGYDDVNVMNFNSSSGLDATNLESIMETLGLTTTQLDEVGNKFIWLYGIMAIGSGAATIANIIKSWKDIKNAFKNLKKTFGGAMMAFQLSLESIGTRVSLSIIGFLALAAAIYAIVRVFSQDWGSKTNKVVAAIGSITMAVGALVFIIGVLTKNAIVATIGAVAAVGGTIATISAFSADEKATLIPGTQLATGGVTTGPVHALVGEGRYNEAVIPLGNSAEFASMKSDITNAVVAGLMSAGGSNGNINITVNVDEDYIYKAYNRQKSLRGGVSA